MTKVLDAYDISFKHGRKLVKKEPSFFERTLIGQSSDLARQIKLQMLGIIWTATGADTSTLGVDAPPNFNITNDPRYRSFQPSEDVGNLLFLSALTAGRGIAGHVPVLIVNEPIFITNETGGTVRYNVPYPRWAYDQYREAMTIQAQKAGWNYLDLWNAVHSEYFFDARLHLSAQGEQLLNEQINPTLQSIGCN